MTEQLELAPIVHWYCPTCGFQFSPTDWEIPLCPEVPSHWIVDLVEWKTYNEESGAQG